jgi:hypothetical protein
MAPKHHHMPLSGGDRKGQERAFEVPADDTHFPERSAEKRREGEAIGLVTICSSYAAGTELPSRRGLNGWKFVALKSPAQRRCWKSFGRSFAAVRKRHHPTNHRVANPSRHFFNPVGPLLVDGATEHENSGRIHRSFLAPIWEWISHDLLPSMAAEYLARMRPLIADEKQTEIRSIRSDLVR